MRGGMPLAGSVAPDGYKHAMVLSFAAAIAAASTVRLANVPRSTEIDVLLAIAAALGAEVSHDPGGVTIDTAPLHGWVVPAALSRAIHGSLYLVPALLGRFGRVTFSGSGGDAIGHRDHGGARPSAHVIEVLAAFGARFEENADGSITGTAGPLRADTIDIMAWSDDRSLLSGPLVSGATKTALLAALQSPSATLIRNPHDKEAAGDLIRFARAAGAAVERTPDGWLVTRPLRTGRPVAHTVMADPTEVMTWISAAVFTGSRLTIGPFDTEPVREALRYEAPVFAAMGIELAWRDDGLTVSAPRVPQAAHVEANVRGVSTDNHPFFTLMLTGADGASSVTDRVWHHRFAYADCLTALGADLTVSVPTVSIRPRRPYLRGRRLAPTDTRAAAVSLLAALAVPGETRISGLAHLHRGYARLPSKLAGLGAALAPASGRE